MNAGSALISGLPSAYQTDVAKTVATLIVYALLLLTLTVFLAVPRLRQFVDPRARLIGQYISAHANNPKGDIVGIFELFYDPSVRSYVIHGTGIDVTKPDAPSGSWTSSAIHFDLPNRLISYVYYGAGADSREGDDGRRALGLAEVVFFDSELGTGRGHFRDDTRDAAMIDTVVLKVTPSITKRFLGRKLGKLTKFDDLFALASAYRRARIDQALSLT